MRTRRIAETEAPALWVELQTAIQGPFSVVADGHGAGTKVTSASSPTAARRGQSRCGSSTGVAAAERLKKSHQNACVPFWTLPHWRQMSFDGKYRGRLITPEDIAFIRQLIAENPSASRRRL